MQQNKRFEKMKASLILAKWQLRPSLHSLALTGLGMLCAIVLTCVAPLLTEVMRLAVLREAIQAQPETPYLSIQIETQRYTNEWTAQELQGLVSKASQGISPFLASTPPTPFLTAISRRASGAPYKLIGTSITEAAPHLTLFEGRLPRQTTRGIEIALHKQTAAQLGLHIGETLLLRFQLIQRENAQPVSSQPIRLTVVGLFTADPNDAFWHNQPLALTPPPQQEEPSYYPLLADRLALEKALFTACGQNTFSAESFSLNWYYRLDPQRITSQNTTQFEHSVTHLPEHVYTTFQSFLNAEEESSYTHLPTRSTAVAAGKLLPTTQTPGLLLLYTLRLQQAIPSTTALLLQLLVLALIFLAITVTMQVEHKAETIALLRSRGASRWQIFIIFGTQNAPLILLTLLLGVPLSFGITDLLIRLGMSQNAPLDAVWTNPLSTFLIPVRWLLITICLLLGTLFFTLYRATSRDMLTVRQTASRPRQKPLWQRLHLDMSAGIVALSGYGMTFSLLHSNVLDPGTYYLIGRPLALIAPYFLVVGCLLLFLRLYPFLLRWGSRLAIRGRGAEHMLALTHIARSPGPFLRMSLLLAVVTALSLFGQIVTASQHHYIEHQAMLATGADFSGTTELHPLLGTSLQQLGQPYREIPGVQAVSLAFKQEFPSQEAGNAQQTDITVFAVDTDTFAQTVQLPDSTSLIQQLRAQRILPERARNTPLPVIINQAFQDRTHLTPGTPFMLKLDSATGLPCIVLAVIPRLPELNDLPGTSTAANGLLTDFHSLAAILARQHNRSLSINHIWLKTDHAPQILQEIRTRLSNGPTRLFPLKDRIAELETLQKDPLYIQVISLLSLGTLVMLLLAFLGNVQAAQQQARSRMTHFALLRALGTAPGQLLRVLLWEQGILYSIGVLLGLVVGLFLAFTTLPYLLPAAINYASFTNISTTKEFFSMLNSGAAISVIIPPEIWLPLLALLGISLLVLLLTVSTIIRASLHTVLRLNAD
ncbi:FtsX-like permease family protein [Thermosporothrix hazakensis]|jgi:ABC-type lipoprotein release transport system permease subunit|uniref:FtsX-like permease family protein n=1 Tax=Thermosporothrix hazakensis TaxID=644383 RepID=A0A326UWN7_THEHA|nr:FtsX-like permease family protein [Thermosporothrix hazakensis]PZW36753.1 FtsX-like permease family protein [Thermosporothrix hazakensis]GCE47403.1 hypothetical protein KTH_22720 [Thermosporothrix hazakensis]